MGVIAELGLSAKAQAFLTATPFKSYIGGEWVASANGQKMVTVDPGSGETLAEFFVMQPADVDRAIDAADKAFRTSGWAGMTPEQRAELLNRWADLVERDAEALGEIEALDGGKLRAEGIGDAMGFAGRLRYYADVAINGTYGRAVPAEGWVARTMRLPYGVCAFIVPWNFPLGLMASGIAPALAAGNTVVVKPASDTPLSTLYTAKLAEEAGIPAGVFNIVAGSANPTGNALAASPKIKFLSLTGSTEAGKSVAKLCAENMVPVKLELGGKGAAVVFDDVNVEDAATGLAIAITAHTGQVCCDATRWIIHEKIMDDFIARVSAKLEAVRVGHGFDAGTQMGPVVNGRQKERILDYIARGLAEGATAAVAGGPVAVPGREGGYYVRPALLVGTLDNVAAREEIFGPVAFAATFRTEEEAVDMVNDTHYGLANSVWSADLARCNRMAAKMESGNSWINGHNMGAPGLPYAGINYSGMGGGTGAPETMYDYMRTLSVLRRA